MPTPYCTKVDPKQCNNGQAQCNNDSDCASDAYCRKVAFQPNACRPKSTVRNIPAGIYCESNEQCKSGLCSGWKCTGKTPYCTKVDPRECNNGNAQCNNDIDCESDAYCRKVAGQPNACRPKSTVRNIPSGTYCESNTQCTSGLCSDWKCTDKTKACNSVDPKDCNKGQSQCNADTDCASDSYCRKVAGKPNTCRLKPSVKGRQLGDYCEGNAQCRSGLCSGWKCTGKTPYCKIVDPTKCNNGKSECNEDVDCEKNSYCRKVAGQPNTCRATGEIKNRPIGEYCEGNGQCKSGLCTNWKCKGKTPYCSIKDPTKCNKGQSECNVDNDCTANAYCRKVAGQPNTCRPKSTVTNIATGKYCESDEQCKTGLCNNWTCTDKTKACTKVDSNQCNDGKSQCEKDADCETDAYCRKVAGQPNACRLRDSVKDRKKGDACTSADQCADGYCSNWACSDTPPPCNIMNLPQCFSDAKRYAMYAIIVVVLLFLGGPILNLLTTILNLI